MDVLITVLEFLGVMAVVVIVHEFGHFAAAKAFGIKVNEFGFGFPPKVVRVFRKGETDYTINLLPIGGFVKLEGENDDSHPRSLAGKGIGTRVIVLVAGVFMNLVLAIVLLTGLFLFTTDEIRIGQVAPGSPAEHAGVLPGDALLEVSGEPVKTFEELAGLIASAQGEEIEWLIKRDGIEQRVYLAPRVEPPEGEGATGIGVEIGGVQRTSPTRSPWDALFRGVELTWSVPGLLKDAITDWLVDDGPTPFAGPVGIAQTTGEVTREAGIISLVPLAAMFSISLAIFNILPIPALDGGRLLFVLLEWVRRGKRIPPEKEGLVHFAGFVALIVLVLGPLTYNDIARIVNGGSLLR
jgi:regulator of sigma E protease